MVCTALLQAQFDYGYNVWYRSLTMSFKNKLQCAQNRMIRYIFDCDKRNHVSFDHFKKLNYLSVKRRIEYLSLSSMYNVFDSSAPMYILKQFSRSCHKYNTRRSQNSFTLPNVKSNGHNSFMYNGAKLWNDVNFKIPETRDLFKSKCKRYMMYKIKNEEENEFVY